MVYTQQLTASEAPSEGILIRRLLLNHKNQFIRKGLLLSDNFIADVESFVERNLIHNKEVCPQCLKGFMLNKSMEHGLPKKITQLLENSSEHEAGHLGYYLDENEVKPVRTV